MVSGHLPTYVDKIEAIGYSSIYKITYIKVLIIVTCVFLPLRIYIEDPQDATRCSSKTQLRFTLVSQFSSNKSL